MGCSSDKRTGLQLLLAAAAFTYVSLPAQAQTIQGRIHSYQCGDNCYLTIVDQRGRQHTGLCTARECVSWNERAAMPSRYNGRRVVVNTGSGEQTDSAGNVMGRMLAFQRLRFLD